MADMANNDFGHCSAAAVLAGTDLTGLWLDIDGDPEFDDEDAKAWAASFVESPPSDSLIASIEAEFGLRLPDAYVALARQRNGGLLGRNLHFFGSTDPGTNSSFVVRIGALYPIGRVADHALLGPVTSRYQFGPWRFRDIGICIASSEITHDEQVVLDYRQCGPNGEPAVVLVQECWVSAECSEQEVHFMANSFADFVRGLFADDPGLDAI